MSEELEIKRRTAAMNRVSEALKSGSGFAFKDIALLFETARTALEELGLRLLIEQVAKAERIRADSTPMDDKAQVDRPLLGSTTAELLEQWDLARTYAEDGALASAADIGRAVVDEWTARQAERAEQLQILLDQRTGGAK